MAFPDWRILERDVAIFAFLIVRLTTGSSNAAKEQRITTVTRHSIRVNADRFIREGTKDLLIVRKGGGMISWGMIDIVYKNF